MAITFSQLPSSGLTFLRSTGRIFLRRRSWKIVGLWLKGLRTLIVNLASVAGVTAIAIFVWREAAREVVQIDPFSVPPGLSDEGYTGEILAQRTMDYILDIHENSKTSMQKRSIGLSGSQPDIVVPGVGFSIGTVATYVGDLIGKQRIRIKGEITQQEKLLYLRLRIDGKGIMALPDGLPLGRIEEVLKAGAEKIVGKAEPYVLASYHYEIRNPIALAEVNEIIRTAPSGSESRMRAYNLRAIMSADQERYQEAIEDYRKAIELDPTYADAYNNLGNALRSANQGAEAIQNYQKAIDLDPNHVDAYNGMGNMMLENRRIDDAIANYQKAIEIDPTYAIPRSNLGNVFLEVGKIDEAIASYRKAIELDIAYASAYYNLGLSFERLGDASLAAGKTDIAESQFQEACTAFKDGSLLESADPDYAMSLARVNRKLPEAKRCAEK